MIKEHFEKIVVVLLLVIAFGPGLYRGVTEYEYRAIELHVSRDNPRVGDGAQRYNKISFNTSQINDLSTGWEYVGEWHESETAFVEDAYAAFPNVRPQRTVLIFRRRVLKNPLS